MSWAVLRTSGRPGAAGFSLSCRTSLSRLTPPAPRCSGALAYHVLEVMTGIVDSPAQGGFVPIQSRPPIPEILPETFPKT